MAQIPTDADVRPREEFTGDQIATNVDEMPWTRKAWLVLCASTTIGCPRGADQSHEGECDPTFLFEEKCGGELCHGPGASLPGGLDLLSPGLPQRLLDQPAAYPDLANCPETHELLVDSKNRDASLLLKKVLGTQSCGQAMPSPNPPYHLTSEEVAVLSCYIDGLIAEKNAAPPKAEE